jgi:Tfp pilus assembly protein FimT
MKNYISKENVIYERKSFTLVELIFSIAILSIVIIGSLSFVSHSFKAYNQSKKVAILELELKSALLFIQNKLSHNIQLKNNQNSLQWYEVDYQGRRVDDWSGYCDINKSNDKMLYSPNSTFKYSSNKLIMMENKKFAINNTTTNKLYFDNVSHKTISNEYILISNDYKLNLEGNRLILHSKSSAGQSYKKDFLLLQDVSRFKINRLNPEQNILSVEICIYDNQICSFRNIILR